MISAQKQNVSLCFQSLALTLYAEWLRRQNWWKSWTQTKCHIFYQAQQGFLSVMFVRNKPHTYCGEHTQERGPGYSRGRCISEDEEQTHKQSFAGEFHAEVVWLWLWTTASAPPAAEHALYTDTCVVGQQKKVYLQCECLACLFTLTGCWNAFHCKMDFLSKILYSNCSATVWNRSENLFSFENYHLPLNI